MLSYATRKLAAATSQHSHWANGTRHFREARPGERVVRQSPRINGASPYGDLERVARLSWAQKERGDPATRRPPRAIVGPGGGALSPSRSPKRQDSWGEGMHNSVAFDWPKVSGSAPIERAHAPRVALEYRNNWRRSRLPDRKRPSRRVRPTAGRPLPWPPPSLVRTTETTTGATRAPNAPRPRQQPPRQ